MQHPVLSNGNIGLLLGTFLAPFFGVIERGKTLFRPFSVGPIFGLVWEGGGGEAREEENAGQNFSLPPSSSAIEEGRGKHRLIKVLSLFFRSQSPNSPLRLFQT